MSPSNPFGARSTADQVLAGIDLSGRRFAVTGCNSGIGFEIMNALAANGAEVIGLARTLDAASAACKLAGPSCSPLACDLADLRSVSSAVESIHALAVPLDCIVANAAIANLPRLQTRYGVELQFAVNHLGHFALVNGLIDVVRNGTGRIVVVTSKAARRAATANLLLDNLDGHRTYAPQAFYDQSKIAQAVYAKELSRRVAGREIMVNSVYPGTTRGTGIDRHHTRPLLPPIAKLFRRDVRRGAATPALLAASPQVAGISGEFWTDCRIAQSHRLLSDADLARHLWDISERIVEAQIHPKSERLQVAA